MRTARQNPIGSPVVGQAVVVRIGSGEHTHLYDPERQVVICNSGKNAGRKSSTGQDNRGKKQPIYKAEAQFVTCYRCQKLGKMNLESARPMWRGPR